MHQYGHNDLNSESQFRHIYSMLLFYVKEQFQHSAKRLILCQTDERMNDYGFRTT